MGTTILLWGAVAGVVHFVFIALAYGNPIVDGIPIGSSPSRWSTALSARW
jgi:hypothetical protein